MIPFNNRLRATVTLLIALVLAGAIANCCSADSGEEIAKQIVAQWNSRRESVKAVRIKAEGTATIFKGQQPLMDGTPFPEKDYSYTVRRSLTLDVAQERIRAETRSKKRHSSEKEYRSHVKIHLFDGTNIQWFRPREVNHLKRFDAELIYRHDASFFFTLVDHPLASIAQCVVGLHPFNALRPAVLSNFRVHKHDDENMAVVALRRVTNPERSDAYDLWVDQARDCVIVRHEYRSGSRHVRSDINYDRSGDSWIPMSWVWEHGDGKMLRKRETLSVTEFKLNPKLSDDVFHIVPKPGMVVNDRRLDENSEAYIEPEPGKQARTVKEVYRELKQQNR